VLNKKNSYQLIIGLALLLFTQLVIPNLHNHSEEDHAYGISATSDDHCAICALDIIPAEFTLPIIFTFIGMLILYKHQSIEAYKSVVIFSTIRQSRAPPVY
jgi:hypothetical protein